ncbi:hypothetical protein LGH83_18115 [Lichenihabitans sp. PAMC28606]|uniref:Pnap_2097 family protein n=1 Tax=Lichenihabitans sp. PAMC28606 TaxID=2880932 RepID=UPI001D0B857B|nr:Pnap_2097 family protein [Lichenihabitans sp. PAMC28606]UDL94400.1 hypothetical protein LGH83_18115 [Lichenihabitans sp. PAMC28606]
MTIAVALVSGEPQGKAAPASLSQSLVALGMPHLTAYGLSETWLLKELGHRHWQLIAQASGLPRAMFRDRAGDTVYAAFCGVTVLDGRLDTVCEHDDLLIASDIARVSRTQFASRHSLSCGGRALGHVEMLSVFVKRDAVGENRSIVRVAVEGLASMPLVPDFSTLTSRVPMLRRGEWTEHLGFRTDAAPMREATMVLPCPSQDFNGAGLLYFSSFQAAVDRVEWETFGSRYPALTTVSREIVYQGNVNIGEPIAIALRGLRETAERLDHWYRVTAASSGRVLADVFSSRAQANCMT